MKANKAPEKIYVDINILGDVSAYKEDWCRPPHCVEYIRKDAFIEKACKWIKEHKEVVETEDNGIMGWIPDYFIEGFKNYMEGE